MNFLNVHVLRSDILDKDIIIGSECLSNFEKDQKIFKMLLLKNAYYVKN